MESSSIFWSLEFHSHLGKVCTQLLLILNNIFHFRLRKTVSVAQLRHQNTFQHMIQNLPLIYKQCREENTIKKYQQYFKTWKEWATAHQVCFLPAEPMHVALFLLSKIQACHIFPTYRRIAFRHKVFP